MQAGKGGAEGERKREGTLSKLHVQCGECVFKFLILLHIYICIHIYTHIYGKDQILHFYIVINDFSALII